MKRYVLSIVIPPEPADELASALKVAGCEVLATFDTARSLGARIQTLRPDAVVIAANSPDHDTLKYLCAANQILPRPIVMFTRDGRPQAIRAATQAGVTSYVVDGLEPARVRSILDVALQRFEAQQVLHGQLEQARHELNESRLIDQAKAWLIRMTGASEPEVYRDMRRAAMDRGLKLADIARQILHKPPV